MPADPTNIALRRFAAADLPEYAAWFADPATAARQSPPHNRASIAMTLKAGFRPLSEPPDEDGMLRLEYRTEDGIARA